MSIKYKFQAMTTPLQSPILLISCIIALAFLADQYARRSKPIPSIPVYVPAKTIAGGHKRRWLSDSVNLLQEGYQKVGDNDGVQGAVSADSLVVL